MDDNRNGCVWAFFIILGLAIFILFVSVNSSPSSDEPDDTMACVVAQRFVRNQLKSPSTAEFPACHTMTISRAGNTWTVASYVDAQNSFGAMLRNRFLAEIEYQPSDNQWYPLDVQISSP